MHSATNPSATVSIDGSVNAGDVATITVAGTAYNYTVVAADTLATITQNLVNIINKGPDPHVVASVGGAFTRVVLTARQPAPVWGGDHDNRQRQRQRRPHRDGLPERHLLH